MALLQRVGRPVMSAEWTSKLVDLQQEVGDLVHFYEIGELATMALSFAELIGYGDVSGPKISDLRVSFEDLRQERQDRIFSAPTNKVLVKHGDLLMGLEKNGVLTKDRQAAGELLHKVLGRDIDLPPVRHYNLRLGKMIDRSDAAQTDVVNLVRETVQPRTVKLGMLGATLLLRRSGEEIAI